MSLLLFVGIAVVMRRTKLGVLPSSHGNTVLSLFVFLFPFCYVIETPDLDAGWTFHDRRDKPLPF